MRKGSALILAILLSGLLLGLSASLIRISYCSFATTKTLQQKEQAFFLAEAGLEQAKEIIVTNPQWYTDLPHYKKDDLAWLINTSQGHKKTLAGGHFKIVREQNKDYLYSIGFKNKSVVILKIKFANSSFKTLSWQQL